MIHPWHDLSPGEDVPNKINVVIEIPKGSRNKYELDKESGMYHLSRVLYSPMIYPGDYGFIPQTYYEDEDPLDVIVLINEPTFVGCIVEVRPVGIFRMLDKGAPDDKILCVPSNNPFFGNIYDLPDVPPHFLMEVAHFFAVYKDLEGSRTLSLGWENAAVAQRQITHGLDLYRKKFGKPIRVGSSKPLKSKPPEKKPTPKSSAPAKKAAGKPAPAATIKKSAKIAQKAASSAKKAAAKGNKPKPRR